MVKDRIEYSGKKYELSTVLIGNCIFETMIFPIINGQVSGSEVYTFRTVDVGKSCNKHNDIYEHPEKYVNDEAIKKYLDSKEDWWQCVENEGNYCEWIKYDYRTIVPREHDINNPYWRIPESMDKLKYCPYCGKKIKITD